MHTHTNTEGATHTHFKNAQAHTHHNTHLIPEKLGDMSTVSSLDEVDGFTHAPVQGVLVKGQGAAGWRQGEGGAGGGQGQRGGGAAH